MENILVRSSTRNTLRSGRLLRVAETSGLHLKAFMALIFSKGQKSARLPPGFQKISRISTVRRLSTALHSTDDQSFPTNVFIFLNFHLKRFNSQWYSSKLFHSSRDPDHWIISNRVWDAEARRGAARAGLGGLIPPPRRQRSAEGVKTL